MEFLGGREFGGGAQGEAAESGAGAHGVVGETLDESEAGEACDDEFGERNFGTAFGGFTAPVMAVLADKSGGLRA